MISFRTLLLCLLTTTVLTGFVAAQKADFRKMIDEATPKALPQAPAAEKLKSDAQDENLKGKVKTVIAEREGLTGIEKPIGRRLAEITDFNQEGNYLRSVYFEYRGKPYLVTVYGYIDGARVSTSKSFGEARLSAPVREKIPQKEVPPSAPDPRYENKYEYKYVDGKLAEIRIFYNTGRTGMRHVYNYKGNQREELAYTGEGELNRKYLYTFDDKGNELERIDFNVRQPEVFEDGRFSFKYESFDEKGNWTKRTFSKLAVENGKKIYKLLAIEYRTITYYQ